MFFGFLDYFQAYSVDMMLQFYRMNLRGWQTIYNFITKLLIIWKQFCIYRRLTCSAEDGFSLRSCWYSQERGRSKLSARYRQTYSSEGNSREQVSVTTAARARARARRRRRRSSQVAHHMRRRGSGLAVVASFSLQLPVLFPPWQTSRMPFARSISHRGGWGHSGGHSNHNKAWKRTMLKVMCLLSESYIFLYMC